MSKKKQLTMLEAVDNLSSLAELDEKEGGKEKLLGETWLDPKKANDNRETVRQSFLAVHEYLKDIYEKKSGDLKDDEMQKGVQAIMTLVGEAGQKVDKFTKLFKGTQEQNVTDLKEYKQLQQFYLTKIIKKFQKTLKQEEDWQEAWGKIDDKVLDIHQRGLKDLETVKRDRDYELFFLRKENGRPFFNPNLIRHIKLVGDLDEMLVDMEGEDPFLKMRMVQDKDLHLSAKEILHLAMPHIDEFYKEALHHKDIAFIVSLGKAIMALMLSANPRNLIQNTTGKSSLSYYKDFHSYLRGALSSEEYQRFLSSSSEKGDRFFCSVVNLSHVLCCFFFMRIGSRSECVELIHRLIDKGRSKEKAKVAVKNYLSFWTNLLEEDDNMRELLKKYPNGPLFKTLDAIRDQAVYRGFDPISDQNLPSQIYVLTNPELHISVLRMPSPTKQIIINESEVVEEFKGFLRSFNDKLGRRKHLLFNLQDRTSWQEHARSHCLEELQKRAEFNNNLVVTTLAKGTEFYYQTGPYLNLNQASSFKKQFKEQIASGMQCGFFFPPSISEKDILAFTSSCIDKVHELFFNEKKQMSRTERLDFIEIFYYLLYLKIIILVKPDTLSFTSKDSVDSGMSTTAGFFCFVKLLIENSDLQESDHDFVLWMLYSSALIVRERLMDTQDLHRIVSAISFFHAKFAENKKAVWEGFNSLFGKKSFDQLKVVESG